MMPASKRHRLAFAVQVRSPFIFAGIEASMVGIDTPALRDERGQPILPADHLKGLLRQALEAIEGVEATYGVQPPAGLDTRSLFGPVFDRDADNKAATTVNPHGDPFVLARGRLLFGDLMAKNCFRTRRTRLVPIDSWREKTRAGDSARGAAEITRIEIDDDTGTITRGMLQVVELAAPLAAVAKFKGEVLFYGTGDDAKTVTARLDKALRLVPYFGGLRSAGFGEHMAKNSSVERIAPEDIIPAKLSDDRGERFTVEGYFDRPFLDSAEQLADNVAEGSVIVPGGVIKGAIAQMLERALGRDATRPEKPLGEVLSRMRISHAFPLGKSAKEGDGGLVEHGRPLPLSAMYDQASKEYACAFETLTPGLINGRCADFQLDWKGDDRHRFACSVGRPGADVTYLTRGHTKIEAETGIAEDQNLFIEVARGALSCERTRLLFRFAVDFGQCGTGLADALRDIKAILANGIDAIGKTNARFKTQKCVADPAGATVAGRKINGKRRWRFAPRDPGHSCRHRRGAHAGFERPAARRWCPALRVFQGDRARRQPRRPLRAAKVCRRLSGAALAAGQRRRRLSSLFPFRRGQRLLDKG
ncbi:MAG: RAMP superfamily CRISPR-associated protein [Methylocella sp.]